MQILNIELIEKFCRKHQFARSPFKRWIRITSMSQWDNLLDIRKDFSSTDYVNGKYVFNLGGNKYRLIVRIMFETSMIFTLHAMTHAEYDQFKL